MAHSPPPPPDSSNGSEPTLSADGAGAPSPPGSPAEPSPVLESSASDGDDESDFDELDAAFDTLQLPSSPPAATAPGWDDARGPTEAITLVPKPIALGPEPITLVPKPIALGPEPIALGPEPITLGPEPITLVPKPIALGPEPITLVPKPIALGPEPITLGPEPIALGPEPTALGPEPIALGPEPIALGPEPIALGPEPIALDTDPFDLPLEPLDLGPLDLPPEPVATQPPTIAPARRPIREAILGATRSLAPMASGTLDRTPLVHLLVYSADQRLTGTTVLDGPDGAMHAIYFEGGAPAKTMTEHSVAPLDRVLRDLRLLDEASLARSLQHVSHTRTLHGDYLVSQGLLTRANLLLALQRQLVEKVTHLFSLPEATRYTFFSDVNLLDAYGGPDLTPAEPLTLVMAGVRTRARDPVVDHTLARLGNMRLQVHPDADPDALGLTQDESLVVSELRSRPMTLEQLRASRLTQQRVAELTVYAMLITRSLQLGAQARPPVAFDSARRKPQAARAAGPVAGTVPIRLEAEPIVVELDSTEAHQGQDGPAGRPWHSGPPGAAGPAPLPRRAIPGATSLAPSRRGANTGRPGGDPPPRRSMPTGRAPEVEPRRGAATGRAHPLPRRGFATGRADPLPRRGTASTAIAPDDTHAPGGYRMPSPEQKTPSPPPAVARPVGPDSSLTRAEISARLAVVDDQNFFEILGVETNAAADAVQAAYFKLAKVWHPDRLPAELRDAQASVGKIFARMNEAHRTLTESKRREEYVRVLKEGSGSPREQEIVARAIDSAMLFRKAEVLLKKGSFEGAAELAAQATEADPGQPEYRAVLAWIRAQLRGLPPTPSAGRAFYREELDVLDEVVQDEPGFERALFYRAELLKRVGEHERAYRDFKAIAAANPRNIDAAREVRLHEVRKRKTRDESAGGGLFGRLLGRGGKKGG